MSMTMLGLLSCACAVGFCSWATAAENDTNELKPTVIAAAKVVSEPVALVLIEPSVLGKPPSQPLDSFLPRSVTSKRIQIGLRL